MESTVEQSVTIQLLELTNKSRRNQPSTLCRILKLEKKNRHKKKGKQWNQQEKQ
jgi:hypothetical protein